MGELEYINPDLSEVDIIYQLLKTAEKHEGKNIKELMEAVFEIKGWALDDYKKMAAIHTQLVLDNRFDNLGQGLWGLKEWKQPKVVRRNLSYGSRTIPYHRRSLQDEIELEYEERESFDKFEPEKEEDDWEDS
jgi:DNA-directed RNA polymerase subunit delta